MDRYWRTPLRVLGERLLELGVARAEICLGTISVGAKIVTNLRPLGGIKTPGVTKAGRLSLQGVCEDRKVKVYSVLRPEQAVLRAEVQAFSGGADWAFPEIIANDGCLVVEAWVDGAPVRQARHTARQRAGAAVGNFISSCWRVPALTELASRHSGAFCYFEDYLLPRLGVWRHLDVVGEFVEFWRCQYESASLPSLLGHADLSADNVLIETATDRVMFIDNELLGVGRGWILDPYNSFIRSDFEVAEEGPVPVDRDFIQLSWALRKAGSAFDAGEPGRAVQLLAEALGKRREGLDR